MCWEGKAQPCSVNKSLHGELPDKHFWSGWPGAHCVKCGEEDPAEGCMADSCTCPCHDEMWRAYEEDMIKAGPWTTR